MGSNGVNDGYRAARLLAELRWWVVPVRLLTCAALKGGCGIKRVNYGYGSARLLAELRWWVVPVRLLTCAALKGG